LILTPLLYAEIPALIAAMGTTYHDASVQSFEVALFGGQVSRTLAGSLPSVAVSELLHVAYLTYYPAIIVPPLLLLMRGERRGYAETVLALTITYLVCWTLFALYPVEGPRYLWAAPVGAPDGPAR